MLEILNKKYIGCRVLASSLCMDKVYTKMILSKANINIAKYIYIRKKNNKYYYYNNNLEENIITNEKIINIVNKSLKFPVFVKPSNSGSSVGITKVDKKEELIEALNFASKYDDKILIEECIIGRELECAILEENENKVKASIIGEVVTPNKFYSFDEKYKSPTPNTIIPARIPTSKQKEIQKIAIKAFKLMDCKDIARIDFFLEEKTGKIILNEINTMPGFTQISMYPKLWENTNIPYQELLDKLINQD